MASIHGSRVSTGWQAMRHKHWRCRPPLNDIWFMLGPFLTTRPRWARQSLKTVWGNWWKARCQPGTVLSTTSHVLQVVKPDSLSTRTRIVSNSVMKNSNSWLSLNDCMWGGPNSLANLLTCLLFWRGVTVEIMMDLRKAYQAIHTSPTELHLRRFFHHEDPELQWETYGYTRVTFEDLSAGLLLEIGKCKMANLGWNIDPQAASQLKDYLYIDDGILGGSEEDVQQMRGSRVDGDYTGTAARILVWGGMSVKFMAVTGSSDDFESEQLGVKNLGVAYDIKSDKILISITPVYYASKSHHSDEVRELVELSQNGLNYLLSRSRKLSHQKWLVNGDGGIWPAWVWNVREGQLTSRLLLAKCRVTPLLGATIPRGEHQSLVILHRLALVIAESFPASFASMSLYTDSLCSIGALQKDGGILCPFFANRVSEVKRIRVQLQDYTDKLPPVSHMPGVLFN